MGEGLHPGRRIGGSDVPKLLGLSPYGNAADVYERVVLGVEQPWTPAMDRGIALEPTLRAHARAAWPELVLEDRERDIHDHPTLDFLRAQVDDTGRDAGLPVVIDYKSQSRWAKGWGAPETDEVPETYLLQLTVQMMCCDRPAAYAVVGFGTDVQGEELFALESVQRYVLERDAELEARIVEACESFWRRHVLPRVPPPMQPTRGKRKRAKS